tara:strand:- start:934 stop:1062 length:129 start_codon:yes stop_codon:yes gene_type:complete
MRAKEKIYSVYLSKYLFKYNNRSYIKRPSTLIIIKIINNNNE